MELKVAILERCEKGQNFVVLLLLLLRYIFPRDFSGTIADTDIIKTLIELFRPTDMPFGGYKTVTKDLGGFFVEKSIFCCSRATWRMKIRISV